MNRDGDWLVRVNNVLAYYSTERYGKVLASLRFLNTYGVARGYH